MSDQEEDVFEDEAQQEDKFEDSSEEDEDEDNFEEDDFIVDDVGDDDEPPEGAAPFPRSDDEADTFTKKKKKKRRRYREDSPELAEGDLQLLEEKGVRIDRKKKLKRLRKGASDEEDMIDDDVRDLARDEEEDRLEERRRAADEPVDYDDDLDDFIDDGGRGRRRRAAERDGLVSSEAVRQARSIFGDVEEMTQYRGVSKLFQKGDAADDDENDEDYNADDPDGRPLRSIQDRDTDRHDEINDDLDIPAEEQQPETTAMKLGAAEDDTVYSQRIVQADIPEQLQYHFGPNYRAPTAAQFTEEADWIYKHGFETNPLFQNHQRYEPSKVIEKIVLVLSYIHVENLDIPFIALYRKDYIELLIPPSGEEFRKQPKPNDQTSIDTRGPRGFNSYLFDDYRPGVSFEHLRGVPRGYDDGFGDWTILWQILDLDKKYADLNRRRQALLNASREAGEQGVPQLVVEEVRSMARDCKDERELADGENYLRLAKELSDSLNDREDPISDFVDEKGSLRKRRASRRKNRYSDFCKRGYRGLAEEFGLSAHQFAENFRNAAQYGTDMQSHVPDAADDEPMQVALVFAERLGGLVDTTAAPRDKVASRMLNAARYILVSEIVAEMQVVQTARSILCKGGTVTVSTIPSAQGISQVDDTHPLRCVTNLNRKPLESFKNTIDFALLLRAVDLGFTTLEIDFQEEQVAKLDKLLHDSFVVSVISSVLVEKWNEERLLVVEEVKKSLMEKITSEIQEELTAATSLVLRNRLSQASSRRFLLGPGRPNPEEDGAPRILSICVTCEDDEEPDIMQSAKDAEDAKTRSEMNSGRRVARERLTFVELDENGEYQAGYELFAAWLRRPMRSDAPNSKLATEVKNQLKSFISRSKAQMIVIGIGSGGRAVMRLQRDIMDIIKEMVETSSSSEKSYKAWMLTDAEAEVMNKGLKGMDGRNDTQNRHDGHNDENDISAVIQRILDKYVVLVDEFPARLYAKTTWSDRGLSVDGMTLLEKRAIALGRLAQEPLWVHCAIGLEEDVAVHFKCHQYHYFAKPSDRIIALRRSLIRAVCTVGVDINRILRLPHMQSMLPFVGGLGEHKSKALIRALENALTEEDHGLPSRKHLWSDNHLGRTVFLSTAAFLRIRDPELHSGGSTRRAVEFRRSKLSRRSRGRRRDDDGSDLFDPMDDSRIHPAHYAVAIKIADEALRDDDGILRVDISDSGEFQESLRMTSAVLDDPSGLQRLALDEYAKRLEQLGRGCLFETVKTIASEFQGPYRDYRQALVSPEPEATFYLVTGADPMMMRIGAAVTGTNCRLKTRRKQTEPTGNVLGVMCNLPHDVRGFIHVNQFSDDDVLLDDDFRRLVPDGSSLACRIVSFVYKRFEATLSSKTSYMENPLSIKDYIPLVDVSDPAYREYPKKDAQESVGGTLGGKTGEKSRGRSTEERMQKHLTHLRSRAKPVVMHPLFHDITGQDAVRSLRGMLPGDIIIRPSQYHKDGLMFSCKFANLPGMDTDSTPRGVFHEDCFVVYDPKNPSVPLRLKIRGAIYEQVDQVLEQYLRPIIENLTECLDHRKFRPGTEEELVRQIKAEKQAHEKSIPYCFGLSEQSPTSLVLVYVPGRSTVKREQIRVVPDGYQLRSVLHKNMDVLFAWFKVNMRKGATIRRPATREAVGASPFQAAASPFQAAASPFRPAASPYHAARSPFDGGATQNKAVPVANDVPPPPAPVPTAAVGSMDRTDGYPNDNNMGPPSSSYPSNRPMRDPYASAPPDRRDPYASIPESTPRITANDWAKATLQEDEPPPGAVQNGDYRRPPSPAARGRPPSPHGRGYPPAGRSGPMSPRRNSGGMSPRRSGGGMSPARSGGMSPRRGMSPRADNERRMDDRWGDDRRGPDPRAGNDPRGGGGRGRASRGRGGGGGGGNTMPTWRGQAPIPAWKKKADEDQRQSQN